MKLPHFINSNEKIFHSVENISLDNQTSYLSSFQHTNGLSGVTNTLDLQKEKNTQPCNLVNLA